jgi:LmbE family N-acetylglucosaminyl deacetylase
MCSLLKKFRHLDERISLIWICLYIYLCCSYINKSILGIFAHPDDETSSAGCTFTKFAQMGANVTVITATRGELGSLGTGDLSVSREELPAVRERELIKVLSLFGANPPILLGYKDQEVELQKTVVKHKVR